MAGRPVSRRTLLRLCVTAAASSVVRPTMRAQERLATAVTIVDHLLLGSADLDRGIEWVEKLTGVRAAIGGSHPGRGTRNALIALGRRRYLEIIAPDPAQPPGNRSMDLRALTEPRLIAWAAATADVDLLAKEIRSRGLQVLGPSEGSRARPDAQVLRWRTLGVSTALGGAGIDPVPFFIQWAADSMHPSQDSPGGCDLTSIEFRHSDAPALRSALQKIGIDATVSQSGTAQLVATVSTPKGRVVIS